MRKILYVTATACAVCCSAGFTHADDAPRVRVPLKKQVDRAVLAADQADQVAKPNAEAGWTVLFDGSNLDAFEPYKGGEIKPQWKIEDSTLHLTGGGAGDLVTKKDYGSFVLEFEWKVAAGSNSGVIYHVRMGDGAPYISGPEYQILDDSVHADGKNPMTSAAAIYALYVPKDKQLKSVGEWNTSKIVIENGHVEHWLNGKQVASAQIGSDDWNERVAASKFGAWEPFGKTERGRIALQEHGDEVWFRNIRIKPLD